jgi:hypothetical protein
MASLWCSFQHYDPSKNLNVLHLQNRLYFWRECCLLRKRKEDESFVKDSELGAGPCNSQKDETFVQDLAVLDCPVYANRKQIEPTGGMQYHASME